MLFTDLLNKKHEILLPEFNQLFEDILKSQSHPGDLLLTRINGFYYPEVYKWSNIENKNPYMIGMGSEGISDRCHYKFIDTYRKTSIAKLTYEDYLKQHIWSEEKAKEIKILENQESLFMQIEMLIYLKIWEADLFIKKFYEIVNLSLGNSYDWHFKINESNRDNDSTGNRETIIRKKIRDQLKGKYPAIYTALKNAYKTQIRNSIAHSRYFVSGNYIHLGNYIEEDKASQIQVLNFEEWVEIFHNTMSIYNQLIGFCNRIDDYYSASSEMTNGLINVRLSRKYPVKKTEYFDVKYSKENNDWFPVK